MRAYVAPIPSTLSRGIHRVAQALARFAPPDITITETVTEADFLVAHVIGPEGWGDLVQRFTTAGRRYGVFQYCLRTTTAPQPRAWWSFWQDAAVVASYYDLRQACLDDGERGLAADVNFLRVPLGVDTTVFRDHGGVNRDFLVGTSGYVAGTECINEWVQVVNHQPVGALMFHLGPRLDFPRWVKAYEGIRDELLAAYWSSCKFVSGLRRSEGFELPAFEGLACGARPVMFDREDARHWLQDSAEYIVEGSFSDIVAQLEALVARPYRPVTAEEIDWVGREFTWERMATRFWQAIPR